MSVQGLRAGANELLLKTTRASLERPGLFVLCAMVLAAICVWLASGLEVRSSFEELLPSDVPSAANVKELVRRVGGDGTVFVVVESLEGPSGLPRAEKLATELTDDLLGMGPDTIRSIEGSVNATKAYFADHWPLFAPTEDLQKALDGVERRANEEGPFALHLDDDQPAKPAADAASLEKDAPWLDPKQRMPRQIVDDDFGRFKDGFLVHPDEASLTLIVRPAGTALGVKEARELLDRMRAVVDKRKPEMDEGHLRVGFAGSFPSFIAEYEAVIRDVASTGVLVVTLVLGSLFLFFRDVRSTAALGVAVLVAVAMTFGVTRLVIGYLNTQTAFLGSIVVGNGINYGLIYLARVRQLRRAGMTVDAACLEAAPVAAHATLLASAASSVSFAMLVAAANRGFRHFGFIGGIGMLLCWVFTFTLVPALLKLFEGIRAVKPEIAPAAAVTEAPPIEAPAWLTAAFSRPRLLVWAFAAAGAAAAGLFIAQPDPIEHDLSNLGNEIKGQQELQRDQDRGNAGLGKSVAGAIALLPSPEAADAFCAVVRERMKLPRFSPVIQGCETVSTILPTDQPKKLALIGALAKRLTNRVISSLPAEQQPRARSIREDLLAQKPIRVEDVPPSLLDRFRERDGTLGRLAAVTAKPDAMLEHGPRLFAFVDGVRNVEVDGKSWDATGENVVFADLLKNIEKEGPITTVGSLLGVCALVLVFFRGALAASFQVVAALITGVVFMGGAAALLHLKINFFNFIVFPITFGIAVDYGANIVVRIRERGGDVVGALAEVGPAVALCSWTSIIGYGTLLISVNRALKSFGWYAVVGEITSILTALVMLPGLALWSRSSKANHDGAPPQTPVHHGHANLLT